MADTTPDPVPTERLSMVVADLQAKAQAQEEEKFVKAQSDITIKVFERSASYNNVILVAGYAGAFTIWSFTRPQLTDKANIAVALSLLVSLSAFIVFEVVKMAMTGRLIKKKLKVFQSAITIEGRMKALKDIEESNASVLAAFHGYWAVTMFITVVSAGIALGLLAYNFVAVLAGLPRWPG